MTAGEGDSPAELLDEVAMLVSGDRSFVPTTARYRDLPEPGRAMVADGLIELKQAERIAALPERVLRELRMRTGALSFSRRRQLCTMLYELFRRDSTGEGKLLKLIDEAFLTADPVGYIAKLRYPKLSRLNEHFQAFTQRHLSGTGITCSPPAYFEGEAFSVSFSFRNPEELRKRISALEDMAEDSDELFELL